MGWLKRKWIDIMSIKLKVILPDYNLPVIITKETITIINSYRINNKNKQVDILKKIFEKDPYIDTRKRKIKDSLLEWRTHNLLYKLNLFKSHCKDCDLDENEAFHRMICYKILGRI